MPIVKQKLTVRSNDRVRYIQTVLEMGNAGAKLVNNTVPKMIAPFTCDLEIELERSEQFKSTPTLIAYPVEFTTYTVKQLEDMVWDEFREAVGQAGVKGRDRKIMIEDYINVIKNSK